MDDRTNALLERQHKDHIAALMISNAKSIAADPSSITGVKASGLSSTKNNSNDPLGSSNSSKTTKASETSDNHNSEDNSPPRSNNSHKSSRSSSDKKLNTGRWSAEEHKRFLAGLDQFGTGNWKKITDMVGTRSCTQIRTHAQKYFIALQKPNSDPNGETGYTRKKSKMLIGAEHHLNSNIKTGSSAIITGYGGGGTPIHPNGIVPVTDMMESGVARGSGAEGQEGRMIKQFWGPGGLREGSSALTGMEVLAQAAITGESSRDNYQYESSLDKAVAELRKKMASEAEAKNNARPSLAVSSEVKDEVSSELTKKRKLEEQHHAHAAAVVSMHHAHQQQQKQQQQQQQHEQQHKKLKESADYAAAVQDTIDRKDVLDKLQAVAERQEFMRLRQEVKTLNQTIIQLQQQSIESDNRVMEAITDRRVTLNECKNLREINAQLKQELRRMVLLFEHTGGGQKGSNSSALMAAATQGANIELMQARLTESELRYHTVTESLSRQTGVLTDQHRAILELNSQLEQERAKRQAAEFELKQLKQQKARGF